MDVNEHERLSNITHKTQNQGTVCSKNGYGCKWTRDYPTLCLRHKIK
jgi:hypothetical protein